MRKTMIATLVGAIMTITGCSGNGAAETITVASRKAVCYGAGKMECFLIKHQPDGQWEFWYDGIEGFDYEPGYEYVIKVRRVEREKGLQDVGSYYYRFADLVSMEEKQSENLPQIPEE